jgi:hypothetical protein
MDPKVAGALMQFKRVRELLGLIREAEVIEKHALEGMRARRCSMNKTTLEITY